MIKSGSFLGVDPGAKGGLAILREDGSAIAFEMPDTPLQLAQLFQKHIIPAQIDHTIIEALHARPGNGSIATFKLGRSCGLIIGMLELAGIKYDEMQPRSWQKSLGITARYKPPKVRGALINYPPEETYDQFKRRLLATSLKLFPRMPLTLSTCDSVLIAEVCRRIHGGFLGRSIR